ncbi:MAG: sugar phosphate isomerase/epimerase family protein [Candidatus Erginobacter occultus]|nr:sugar phosphate isomerase/epimerase family protein [Candidatus Erginobacter occultus]
MISETKEQISNPVLLSSGSLRNYGLNRVFETAAGCGYDGVELIVDEHTDSVHADYIRKLIERYSLPVPVVHAPFNFLDPPGWEKDELSRLVRSLRLAEEVGARSVVLHTPFYTDRAFRRWLEEDLAGFQKKNTVTILVENMPCYRKVGGRLGKLFSLSDLAERDRRGFWKLVPNFLLPPCFPLSALGEMDQFPNIILDTTHLGTAGIDPIAAFERFRDRIGHIHLSNYDGREHLELQTGILDLAAFLHHTARSGYRGGYCLEIMPEYFDSHDSVHTIRLLSENLAFIRRHSGRE